MVQPKMCCFLAFFSDCGAPREELELSFNFLERIERVKQIGMEPIWRRLVDELSQKDDLKRVYEKDLKTRFGYSCGAIGSAGTNKDEFESASKLYKAPRRWTEGNRFCG